MSWQSLRELILPKAYDLMIGMGMLLLASAALTISVAFPIVIFKYVTTLICK